MEAGKEIENGGNGGDKEQPRIFVTIEMHPEKGIIASGVIENEPVALWLLIKGKAAIEAHNIRKAISEQPKIQKPHGILNFARKKH